MQLPSIELTERFIKGLQNYNLTYDEIVNGNWKYCGGRTGSHLNYFKISCKDDDLPEQVNECVCGHAISENCYITDGESILVLGNCCIKKFIPKSSRTCENCEAPHKNRTVNRCNKCRDARSSKFILSPSIPTPTRVSISDELASFIGKEKGIQLTRFDICNAINAYIKDNKLQDDNNCRKINPDPKLRALLNLDYNTELNYFNLYLFIKKHCNCQDDQK